MKQEAIQASWQALQCDPSNAMLLYNLGTNLAQAGDYQQAAFYFKKAVLQDPSYSLAVFNLAMCYDQLGQLDDALIWYQRSAEIDSADPDPIYNIAEIHFRLGDFSRAEELCMRSLDMFDTKFRDTQFLPYIPISESFSREQLLTEIAYKKANAHHLMALIQSNQAKWWPALESMRRAIEINPHNAKWFMFMAEIYRKLGDLAGAQIALARAGELDPNLLAS